ncbi:MAG TPA: Spy/CpxP family protein refolding chaperone [Chthoniobacterales bacterium]
MNFRPFLVPILATLACSSLQAQTPDQPQSAPLAARGEKGHHGNWIAEKLNLSDTQKNDLKTYRQQHKAEFRTAMAGIMAAKLKLQADVNADDQPAISTDAAALGQAAAQLAKVRAAELNYLKGLLNPEQVTTWQNLQQKRQSRMQNRIDRLGQTTG